MSLSHSLSLSPSFSLSLSLSLSISLSLLYSRYLFPLSNLSLMYAFPTTIKPKILEQLRFPKTSHPTRSAWLIWTLFKSSEAPRSSRDTTRGWKWTPLSKMMKEGYTYFLETCARANVPIHGRTGRYESRKIPCVFVVGITAVHRCCNILKTLTMMNIINEWCWWWWVMTNRIPKNDIWRPR